MKDIWKSIKGDYLPAISLAQFLLSTGAAVYTFIAKNGISLLEFILFAVVIAETAIILGSVIWQRTSYKSYYYPYSKIWTDYTVLSKTIEYKLEKTSNGEHELHYSREMKLKAKKDQFDNFIDFYHWSGDPSKSTANKPKGVDGIAEITDRASIGIWTYFRVRINEKLDKGREKTVKYKWPTIQNAKASKPFFSTSTEVATKMLILKLDLGPEYKGQKIRKQTYRANESLMEIANSNNNAELDEYGRYEWKIDNVRRFRYYRIIWNWTVGEEPKEM